VERRPSDKIGRDIWRFLFAGGNCLPGRFNLVSRFGSSPCCDWPPCELPSRSGHWQSIVFQCGLWFRSPLRRLIHGMADFGTTTLAGGSLTEGNIVCPGATFEFGSQFGLSAIGLAWKP
jgi:hypothetical protein